MPHPVIHHTKRILNKPKIVISASIVVALIIGVVSYLAINPSKNYATTAVTLGTVSSSLSTTGTVKAATQTALAFPKSGRVASVSATVGSRVTEGQVLAALDSADAEGAVETARGAYQAAQANYARLQNGASSSDIEIAKLNYDSTVSEQALAVQSAYQKLLSSDLQAVTTSTGGSVTVASPIVSGTYALDTEGTITITAYSSGSSGYFTATGLVTATGAIDSQIPQAIGGSGLFIIFPGLATSYASTVWTIDLPNTKGPSYTMNSTAYTAAVQNQTDKVASAKAALDKVQAAPRAEDIAQAEAQVASAAGALQTAQGALANDFITAPISGTITSINDITAGSIVSANTPVIGIMSDGAFQIESYVSEKDLSLISSGEPVSIITDAYGPSVVWKGTVVSIDPAATEQPNGQLGYKVTYQFTDTDPRIKPGISASVTVEGEKKEGVLEIPRTAIFLKDGSSFVLVRNGSHNEERPVTVGTVGATTAEITSGLSQGEMVVTLGNN